MGNEEYFIRNVFFLVHELSWTVTLNFEQRSEVSDTFVIKKSPIFLIEIVLSRILEQLNFRDLVLVDFNVELLLYVSGQGIE